MEFKSHCDVIFSLRHAIDDLRLNAEGRHEISDDDLSAGTPMTTGNNTRTVFADIREHDHVLKQRLIRRL